MSSDMYEDKAQIAKVALVIALLEKEGRYREANELRLQLNALRMQSQFNDDLSVSSCRGNSESETISNIKNGVLQRIRNNAEHARWVYEELDAAYRADYTYGFLKNTRKFALNSGIPLSDFEGTLDSSSSIDRADGPQQFITRAMEYFFGQEPNKKVATRIKIVQDIIRIGFQKGVF